MPAVVKSAIVIFSAGLFCILFTLPGPDLPGNSVYSKFFCNYNIFILMSFSSFFDEKIDGKLFSVKDSIHIV
jgi:hypothetical protein